MAAEGGGVGPGGRQRPWPGTAGARAGGVAVAQISFTPESLANIQDFIFPPGGTPVILR